MPEQRVCSIEDCIKPVDRRGWCSAHYTRWRRHGVIGGPIRRTSEFLLNFVNEIAIPFRGDGCLLWPSPLRKDNYPLVNVNGKVRIATRYVCTQAHGDPPSPKHECCHSCGNRHCVNPNHLRWGTKADNIADMFTHGTVYRGTKHFRARLTETDVLKIRELAATKNQTEIAEMYSVAPSTVAAIIFRRSWKHLDGGSVRTERLTPEQRREVGRFVAKYRWSKS
jgi:hypothetical protein